ncbi:MAG: CPBP family intramembrane metalloprotease [Acidobacteria bacterium]|nr:CPBP family intramembrane metalloprotease [Acidobacteriota bacterium]
MATTTPPSTPVTRRKLVGASVVSVIIFVALAAGVSLFRFHSLEPLAISVAPLLTQVAGGLLVGTAFAVSGLALLLKARVFESARRKGREVLRATKLGRVDFAIMAIGAGVGEELFFRAALQPLVGLWISSVLFTIAHYWVPLTGAARLYYATFVLAISVALGGLLLYGGLLAAIVAHATVDMIILFVASEKLGEHFKEVAR